MRAPAKAEDVAEEFEILVVRNIVQIQKIRVTVLSSATSPRTEARQRACAEAKAWNKWEERTVSEPFAETIHKIHGNGV